MDVILIIVGTMKYTQKVMKRKWTQFEPLNYKEIKVLWKKTIINQSLCINKPWSILLILYQINKNRKSMIV